MLMSRIEICILLPVDVDLEKAMRRIEKVERKANLNFCSVCFIIHDRHMRTPPESLQMYPEMDVQRGSEPMGRRHSTGIPRGGERSDQEAWREAI